MPSNRRKARQGRRGNGGATSRSRIVPVKDQNGIELLAHDELMAPPPPPCRRWAALEPQLQDAGRDDAGLRRRGPCSATPEIEKVNHVHHAGNSSGIVDGAAANPLIGNKEFGEKAGLKSRAPHASGPSPRWARSPAIMLTGPGAVLGEGAEARRHEA